MAIWEAETFLMSLQLPPYTYSERSIPYLENPDAYHTGTFNKSTYFNKIDAIKDGNLNKLNGILESEGIEELTQLEFSEFSKKYVAFLQNTNSSIGGNIKNYIYGIHGKAAPWGDMIGGAEQIVTPFNGQDMLDLGMIIQRR
ncbi:hypothetical protein ACVRXS_07655 [Streptococcus orisratti]|uniref:hypothetical protein n=1 Tax=Streptococcus orisratti TaxID=114652 RepID=UPI0012EA1787|nr:hypothetical protein [Streptococcus orisratti]